MTDGTADYNKTNYRLSLFYDLAKTSVIRMAWAQAQELRPHQQPHFIISETPRYVGRAVVALAADSEVARWNGQSLSGGQLAKVYGFTDLDGSQPDAWRYVPEVQDAHKPADATGYR